MNSNYKKTVAGSLGAGVNAMLNSSDRRYYILEHKTESTYHHLGESQKIIVDQIEMGRDSSCQVRFDESFETVSRKHAAIVKDGDGWKLIPLSQTNATLVNGQPVSGEWHLNSGDEIRLSSNGPLMGFIIPQGKSGLTNSIGFTERLGLFRQQALRPYKMAITIITIILLLAIAGLSYVVYNSHQELETMKNDQAAVKEELAQKEREDQNYFSELDNCSKAVYYVKMNKLSISSPQGQEIITFNTDDLVGGTGFIMEDGRFVTARRVVEPWLYYKKALGRDESGVEWNLIDIQALVNFGYKVVADFTAYSPSGANFNFKNTDMTLSNPVGDITEETLSTSSKEVLLKLLGKKKLSMKWYNSDHVSDWATMAKQDQLGVLKGLKYDNNASLNPKVHEEVKIIGYPMMQGFVDSKSLSPVCLTNNVNVTGLNNEGMIELSSSRYQRGNNGAPVLLNKNGLWVVVGVLCETDSADRDVVVPIGYVK